MTAAVESSSLQTLTRLLTHLDRSLSPSAPSNAKPTHYELNKTRSNIQYARTLLLTLEKQASTIRVQSQRQNVQADLAGKREVIKRLNSRVAELEGEVDESDEDDDDEDSDEDADVDEEQPVSYAPARHDTQNSLDTGGSPDGGGTEHPGAQIASALHSSIPQLRQRQTPLNAADNRSAASTTAREQLFTNRSQQPQATSGLSQSETLLSHNRTEQENLTTGLLSLAKALKESSVNFGASLETEKEVLKRAEGGLDKNAQGMEAAEKKMGTLRKMSEGQGLWGRIKLYGMIAALWVVCFLVVFVGPKLRFSS